MPKPKRDDVPADEAVETPPPVAPVVAAKDAPVVAAKDSRMDINPVNLKHVWDAQSVNGRASRLIALGRANMDVRWLIAELERFGGSLIPAKKPAVPNASGGV